MSDSGWRGRYTTPWRRASPASSPSFRPPNRRWGPRRQHADIEVTLLRPAQGAPANVAKHANAHRVGLTLSYMQDMVTLDVRDDGEGFDLEIARANDSTHGGFGLAGMRQRVQRVAGQLHIESEPGSGTAISASVPAIPARGGQ